MKPIFTSSNFQLYHAVHLQTIPACSAALRLIITCSVTWLIGRKSYYPRSLALRANSAHRNPQLFCAIRRNAVIDQLLVTRRSAGPNPLRTRHSRPPHRPYTHGIPSASLEQCTRNYVNRAKASGSHLLLTNYDSKAYRLFFGGADAAL